MPVFRLFALTASLFCLLGCGKLESLFHKSGDQSSASAAPATQLEGVWQRRDGVNGTISLRFEGNRFKVSGETDNDLKHDGTAPYHDSTVLTGTFTIGAASASVAGAQELNLSFDTQSVTRTPQNQTAVDTLNQANLCGITGWKVNEPLDFMAYPNCYLSTPDYRKQTLYTLFAQSGSQLQLGHANDAQLTPDQRSTRLDTDTYTKQ